MAQVEGHRHKDAIKTCGGVLVGMGLSGNALQLVVVAVTVYVLYLGLEAFCAEGDGDRTRPGFDDPAHVTVFLSEGGDIQSAPAHPFAGPLDREAQSDLQWYLEVYPVQYTTELDDDRAKTIGRNIQGWGEALFAAVFADHEAGRLFDRFASATKEVTGSSTEGRRNGHSAVSILIHGRNASSAFGDRQIGQLIARVPVTVHGLPVRVVLLVEREKPAASNELVIRSRRRPSARSRLCCADDLQVDVFRHAPCQAMRTAERGATAEHQAERLGIQPPRSRPAL